MIFDFISSLANPELQSGIPSTHHSIVTWLYFSGNIKVSNYFVNVVEYDDLFPFSSSR